MSGLTDRLRQVASRATPGPWEHLPSKDVVGPRHAAGGRPVVGYGTRPGNAEHLATFDPVLVSAMLNVIDAADRLTQDGAWSSTARDLEALDAALARFREVSS